MNKMEKLKKLDDMLLDEMLSIMEEGATERLGDLATLSNYLAKNNQIAEKQKSSLEDEIKDKVSKAQKRRDKIES